MSKSLTPTRADRLLLVFKRLALSIQEMGMSRQLIEDDVFHGDSIVLQGRKLGNFGLCSYLALGDDPRVKDAAKDAIDRFGASYSSSIAYTAVPLYGDLRQLLSEIFDASVVIAGTTTLAHLAALPVMVRPGDEVFIDAQSHSSVMLGTQVLQASEVSVTPIPHNDLDRLEKAIAESEAERIWFLTDGVFSMKGDTAPAEALVGLLDAYPNLHLYVDDAHGFGWAGLNGRGQFLHRVGWHERLVLVVGLAKAFGSLGGVIVTPDPDLAETIELTGPVLTFGGPIPPPNLGASVAAAKILLSDEVASRQQELMDRIRLVNEMSTEIGLPLAARDDTPLWFLDVGELTDMRKLLQAVRDRGFYLNAAAFPVVPQGHAGLRFTVTIDNPLDQIQSMLFNLNDARLQLFGETQIEVDVTNLEAEEAPVPTEDYDQRS